MDTGTLVLIILTIIYIPIWVWVWRNPEKAAKFYLVKYGPLIMIKTHLGIKSMDKIAKYRRFWLVFGFISRLLSAILFLVMMYMLIMSIIALPSKIGSGGIGIQYALAIPGFNPMLPLSYGIIALFVAMVVHEMGHGIQSRVNGCKVDSTGLLYGVVPWGAFCEPNEEDLSKLPRRPQMDIYAAGISVNTVLAAISIALMLLILSGVSVADFGQDTESEDLPGVYYIDADSPAFDSEVPTSALITGIKLYGEDTFHSVTAITSDKTVAIQSDIEILPTSFYVLEYALEDESHLVSEPLQMGALIKSVSNNSPAKEAGLKTLTYLYSITINGKENYIHSSYDFFELMKTTSGGDEAIVKTVTITDPDSEATIDTHEQVTLTSSGSQGYLGISVTNAGFTMITPSLMMEKATDPFYGATDAFGYVQGFLTYLSGPINGLDPIPDSITWWYDAPSGDITWIVVKMLFWIFWLDILLAISNALPAYPFDGGFLFEGGVNWLLEVFGVKEEERRKKMSESISRSISTVTLLMFALVILTFII
jgi:membrane-associated protease RseP (regulator of RpoE activity)